MFDVVVPYRQIGGRNSCTPNYLHAAVILILFGLKLSIDISIFNEVWINCSHEIELI